MSNYPLLSSPEKSVLRSNINKGNAMRVEKRSYESVRKSSMSSAGLDIDGLDAEIAKVRDSRTLVKKRQPWDKEPRGEMRRP